MGRPRKHPLPEVPHETEVSEETHVSPETTEEAATERVIAPETIIQPIQKSMPTLHVERQGSNSEPFVRHHPQVRGGICEFCGVIDPKVPSQYQYKLCPHYRGMALACSYCPDHKDPDSVNYAAVLNIVEHPWEPNTLIACCNGYTCEQKHQARFRRNS